MTAFDETLIDDPSRLLAQVDRMINENARIGRQLAEFRDALLAASPKASAARHYAEQAIEATRLTLSTPSQWCDVGELRPGDVVVGNPTTCPAQIVETVEPSSTLYGEVMVRWTLGVPTVWPKDQRLRIHRPAATATVAGRDEVHEAFHATDQAYRAYEKVFDLGATQ